MYFTCIYKWNWKYRSLYFRYFRKTASVCACAFTFLHSYLVEFFEIFSWDHIIWIEIQYMKKEIPKLVLLEVCKEIAARLNCLKVCYVVGKAPMNPCRWRKRGKKLANWMQSFTDWRYFKQSENSRTKERRQQPT